ncbi:hypothetical protein LG943_23075 [Streptomonospora sp. S1-112]|uniref:DNA primase n=1 Tax=Streptomonospora mangrovi TaxID=2883123 RepID=A0A9X3SFS5_9ACTN|nr:hypothetical protein [Streptomonospora mangrovi]MDA0567178.1 hypothetical protein [Streptomonospora mangrovi]
MNQTGKIVAAAVGGYILGRRKKFKLAVGLGLYLGARKLNISPQMVVKGLTKELGALPVVGELKDQTRDQLVATGKDAAGKLVTKWAGGLADSLNDRTERLRGGASEAASSAAGAATGAAATATGRRRSQEADEDADVEEPAARGGDAAEDTDDTDDRGPEERADDGEDAERAERPARTRSSGTRSATRKAAGAATGTARKAAPRKRAAKPGTTRRRASSGEDGDKRG